MVDQPTKFIRNLDAKQSKRVRATIAKIKSSQVTNLDIKPLTGYKGWYRCRVGKVRIVFIRVSSGHNIVRTVDFRGGVYKK